MILGQNLIMYVGCYIEFICMPVGYSAGVHADILQFTYIPPRPLRLLGCGSFCCCSAALSVMKKLLHALE